MIPGRLIDWPVRWRMRRPWSSADESVESDSDGLDHASFNVWPASWGGFGQRYCRYDGPVRMPEGGGPLYAKPVSVIAARNLVLRSRPLSMSTVIGNSAVPDKFPRGPRGAYGNAHNGRGIVSGDRLYALSEDLRLALSVGMYFESCPQLPDGGVYGGYERRTTVTWYKEEGRLPDCSESESESVFGEGDVWWWECEWLRSGALEWSDSESFCGPPRAAAVVRLYDAYQRPKWVCTRLASVRSSFAAAESKVPLSFGSNLGEYRNYEQSDDPEHKDVGRWWRPSYEVEPVDDPYPGQPARRIKSVSVPADGGTPVPFESLEEYERLERELEEASSSSGEPDAVVVADLRELFADTGCIQTTVDSSGDEWCWPAHYRMPETVEFVAVAFFKVEATSDSVSKCPIVDQDSIDPEENWGYRTHSYRSRQFVKRYAVELMSASVTRPARAPYKKNGTVAVASARQLRDILKLLAREAVEPGDAHMEQTAQLYSRKWYSPVGTVFSSISGHCEEIVLFLRNDLMLG